MDKRISSRAIIIDNGMLLSMFRRKIKDGKTKEYYVIPGGGINEGEDIVEGLKRELIEELNVEADINDLAFTVETDERIEYFYNCTYKSGDFTLNGEELDRMSESNYYEPTFISLDKLDEYDVMDEVKAYYSNHKTK